MTRKIIVVAIIAATSFVSMSSESEAFHRRRAKHGLNRHCAPAVTTPISTCDTGCGGYASAPVAVDCGCSTGMSSYAPYTQPQVYSSNYGTNMNMQADFGSQMGCGCGDGSVGAANHQIVPHAVVPQQVVPQ